MEVIHEPTSETVAAPAESTAREDGALNASARLDESQTSETSSLHSSEPTTEQPATWPPPEPPQQRTTGQRGLIIALLISAVVLDGYELLTLVADLGVVVGTVLRYIAIPFEALYFVLFLYLCWHEKIPTAQRRVINGIRAILTFLEGFEFFANFIPVIGGILEALPLKIISVIVLFYLRPLAERLLARVPVAGELIHAAAKKGQSQKV